MVGMAIHVVKSDGVLALYSGLSASLCRQVRVVFEHVSAYDFHQTTFTDKEIYMCVFVLSTINKSSLLVFSGGRGLFPVVEKRHIQFESNFVRHYFLLPSQMSYSLTRFAIYETVRDMLGSTGQGPMPFYQKVLLGAFGGGNTHILLLFFLFLCTHAHTLAVSPIQGCMLCFLYQQGSLVALWARQQTW